MEKKQRKFVAFSENIYFCQKYNNTDKMALKTVTYIWRRASVVVVLAVAALLTSGCVFGDHRKARRAAEAAWNDLKDGDYDDYLDRIYYADSMTDDYRSQLADCLATYIERERERAGGIKSVEAVGDTIFEDQAHVFLMLTFGDGTQHQVGVPMVKVDGKWKVQ